MPAYMIVLAKVRDREKFLAGYAPAAAKLVAQFGGRYLLRAPAGMRLEGELEPGQSVVISEWPDRETALRFWNSPEYAAARALRDGIADVEVVLVEAPQISDSP